MSHKDLPVDPTVINWINRPARDGRLIRANFVAVRRYSAGKLAAVHPLPPKQLLLQACRGLPPEDHPVLRSAGLLADLHERRLTAEAGATAPIDHDRVRLVLDIDRWVAAELPKADRDAHLHTETVGTVVDRLAQFSALAYLTLAMSPDDAIQEAAQRLTELAIAYEHLAGDLAAGRRRLPNLTGNREYEY
ncbi:DUF4254 domain-containing protein [Nocardia sp. NPDC051030]|uniref:DUF4254 domain-containing protein n=1 Tax=Nocardia sp. NPDC051030 TaxID=3155162 RepID=UPI00343F7972